MHIASRGKTTDRQVTLQLVLLSSGAARDVEQHQEGGDSNETAGGATAGERGGQHSQAHRGVRRSPARVPRGVPQDGADVVLVHQSVRPYRCGTAQRSLSAMSSDILSYN